MNNPVGLVLLPGAGLGPQLWDDLVPLLPTPSLAVRYPGEGGLAEYIASVRADVDGWAPQRVVVVGHSLGGVVALGLARELGNRLAGFVGVSAAIPARGGSFASAMPFPQRLVLPVMLRLAGTRPPESSIRKGLCSDLSTDQADQIVQRFTPEPRAVYTDRVGVEPPDVPKLYVMLSADREFSLKLQATFAKRLGGRSVELHSGHLPMVSHPSALAETLTTFAGKLVDR
jgi:pimeloyl-ACP methyl ester carboxylesterase